MKRISGIYKITNLVNGKFYIGQSTHIKQRFKEHRDSINRKPDDPRGQGPLYDDMRKYGLENFTFEILEECPIEKLDEREEYYIALYDAVNKGYNRCKTAVTLRDEEVKAKIFSEERIEQMRQHKSEWNKQKWKEPEYRKQQIERIREMQKKRLEDPTYRQKKAEDLRKGWEKKKKKVAQYTLDGKLIAIYDGVRVAERATGIRSIDKCAKGKRKTAGGFVWKYVSSE